MRRKNRKWVAVAAVVYLFVMWCAYRWAIGQRPADGNILDRIEREEVRKNREKRARQAAEVAKLQQPIGRSRLEAAEPAFFAARYDQTHVVFMVVAETEARFSNSPMSRLSGTPTKVAAPPKPFAPLGGLQELWEPDSHALHFFPEIIQQARTGDQWMLDVSPDSTVPVEIERVVVAPTGCTLALGFLAAVAHDFQNNFALSPREYFVVRKNRVESADPPATSRTVELSDWKVSPAVGKQIEKQLNKRMLQELAKIDARLIANAGSPGATTGESPIGSARPRLKEWIHADRALARGEGTLDYDIRAFRLTPDSAPRLLVRARWKLAEAALFLMTAWFKGGAAQAELLFADASWSTLLRGSAPSGSLGEDLGFQSVLNEFDADHDGWGELLIRSGQGGSSTIGLYLYTDLGLVPLKTPFRRGAEEPESCLDP